MTLMHEKRFHFIEVSGSGEGPIPTKAEPVLIPDTQYLSYFDLIAMQPSAQALKKLSKKLIEKYQCLPLALQPKHLAFRLPKSLDSVYHSCYGTPGDVLLYIGLCEPQKEHTQRIIHNATGTELYIVPLAKAAFQRYLDESGAFGSERR